MYISGQIEHKELKRLLGKLHKDTVTELKEALGDNYKDICFREITAAEDVNFIKLKDTDEAVGIFGLTKLDKQAAGIFLLTTDELYKGNIVTFLKGAKKQVEEWEKRYPLIMDRLYKKHRKIKKWLLLLGFKPSEYEDENFQVYYKGDISKASF